LNLRFGILRLLIEALGPSGDVSIDVSPNILARTHASFAGASSSLCRNCLEAVARGVGNTWKI
jgi:hypothetical protein